MKILGITALLLALTGCISTVGMVNPKTGEERTCGPYSNFGIPAAANAMREAQCIQDYKEQGFIRK